ncbi:MAG: cell wall hydrolase [Symploca sp. SIO1C4]|uniref:Cell wall hydrolase n=1 Tax=Symploca sp. SIO1C4 TaxID=2607765 RepID=A0A6B3NH54_9CYAN|nr:cell wall hydrolase [Symploca sp. SIO1C4]NET07763.1 cell wall hydrolase [Symploca sp. SIO2B6]
MKFGIDMGHNAPPDVGARGIKIEDQLTKAVGTKLIEKLKSRNHRVINCTPSRATSVLNSLSRRVNTANWHRVDVFVSIHFNAFNGKVYGAEIYGVSDTSKKIAKPVLDKIVKLGFFNRKVKHGSHLYVLRNTRMPAILIECCFCDSRRDMELFDAEAMATAIAEGLTGESFEKDLNSDPDDSAPKTVSIPEILKLQQALNKLKIVDKDGKALAENGVKNRATESATQNLQSILNLNADGIAGPATWGAINQILAQPIVRENHAGGIIVRYLQYRVGADIDGIYGPGTNRAIRKLQAQYGLVADGIIGPATWGKLLG